MRARLALAFANIEYEAREVDLKNKPAALLDISPKGTVPVLLLPDGKILDESLNIVLWAMPKPLPLHEATIMQLINENDTGFKYNNHRYKYSERYLSDGKSQEVYRHECEKFITILEQKLLTHKCLISDTMSIADVAIFPLIRQFSMVDSEWFTMAPYPNVRRWLNDISISDYYIKAMQKLSIWHE